MAALVGKITTKIIGDDWTYVFTFATSSTATSGGIIVTPLDISSSTFSANLITESPSYTSTAITGGNGSVDSSLAASGTISVTVAKALTSTLTPDMDSVDVARNASTSFNTRLVLIGDAGALETTWAIMPIRVVRR